MMRQAWHAWFFKDQRIWAHVAAVILLAGAAAYDLRDGRLGTVSIVGLTVLVLFILILLSCYRLGVRRAISKLDAIVDGRAVYILTDSTIDATSSLGSVSLTWSAVSELRRYHDLILLGFRGATYSVIPAAQIPAEALSFLIERCRAAGTRLVDL